MATLLVQGAMYSVSIPDFQWQYVYGKQFGERNINETEYGKLYRERTGVVQRHQAVRFVGITDLFTSLRQLSMIAGRKALPVQFDDELGSVWTVDWPDTVSLTWLLDNRQEMTVTLLEQVT